VFYFCLHYLPYLAIEKDKDTNNILKRKPTTISRHINCKMVVVLVIVVAIIAEKNRNESRKLQTTGIGS